MPIRMSRPHRLNAISEEVVDLLGRQVPALLDDPEIRVLVWTGTGRGFCAGGDVGNLGTPIPSVIRAGLIGRCSVSVRIDRQWPVSAPTAPAGSISEREIGHGLSARGVNCPSFEVEDALVLALDVVRELQLRATRCQ
jgi:enoyl-CoA hydratase/isomerase-like protein